MPHEYVVIKWRARVPALNAKHGGVHDRPHPSTSTIDKRLVADAKLGRART
jgi:hypothetical protein